MIFSRETTIDASLTGDTTLQAILDLDHDLSLHYSNSNYTLLQCSKKINKTEVGVSRGVCELDSSSLIPEARLPTITSEKLPPGTVPPSGSIALWPAPVVPSGWIECDGSKLNTETYKELFGVVGYSFGGSDNEGEFGVPDLRGYFVRCASHGSGVDPDAYYRDEREDGESGDAVGTKQGSENIKHTHSFSASTSVAGYGAASFFQFSSSGSLGGFVLDSGYQEGCPINIALAWIIKT